MEVGQYRNGFYFHAANDGDCRDYDKEGEEGERHDYPWEQ